MAQHLPRIAATALFVTISSQLAADVIHVPDAEAGILTIADGLAAADPGDVVEVAAGTYIESLVITEPDIELRGIGTAVICAASTHNGSYTYTGSPGIKVSNISSFRLRNMTVRGFPDLSIGNRKGQNPPPPSYTYIPAPAIEATGSDIHVSDSILLGGGGLPTIVAENSNLTFVSTEAAGRDGKPAFADEFGGWPHYASPGQSGGSLKNSTLSATDCDFSGGRGGAGRSGIWFVYHYISAPGAAGGAGLQADLGSYVVLINSTSTGGGGGAGAGSAPPGNGACGIRVLGGSDFVQSGSTLTGGVAGNGGTGTADPGSPTCGYNRSGAGAWDAYE